MSGASPREPSQIPSGCAWSSQSPVSFASPA